MKDYKNKKIWAVGNVEDKAKDRAKELAKLDKKKIGPWLTELILNKNSQSNLDIKDELHRSNDINKIINYLEAINNRVTDIYFELSNITVKISSLKKKTFFDKFLR